MKKIGTCISIIGSLVVVAYLVNILYRGGLFGNYYLEQEIFEGKPYSWLHHNGNIVWSHGTPIDQFNANTFKEDSATA